MKWTELFLDQGCKIPGPISPRPNIFLHKRLYMWSRRSELLENEFRFGSQIFGNGVHPCFRPGQSVADWKCKYNSRWTEPSCSFTRLAQYLYLSYIHKSASAKCRTLCRQRKFEINTAIRNYFYFLFRQYKKKIPIFIVLVKDSDWGRAHFKTKRYAPLIFFVYHGATSPVDQGLNIIEDSVRNTTLIRTPLDEWSALRSAIFLTPLTADNVHATAGFEPTISAGEQPQTHALVSVCSLCYTGARRSFSALYYIVWHGLSGDTEYFHLIS